MRFSIITINLNNKSGLVTTIESVLSQKNCEIEYIIIDGNSSDNSQEVIKTYQRQISKWVSEEDGGIFNAMNKGLSFATGDFVLFLNSGDYFKHSNVIDQASLLISSTLPAIYYGLVEELGKSSIKIKDIGPNLDIMTLFRRGLPHQAVFYPRSVYTSKKYNEKYKIAGDRMYNLELYASGYRFHYLPFIITTCTMGGISSKADSRKFGSIEYCAALENSELRNVYNDLSKFNTIQWHQTELKRLLKEQRDINWRLKLYDFLRRKMS